MTENNGARMTEEQIAQLKERNRVLGIKADIAISQVLEINAPTVNDLVVYGSDIVVRISKFLGSRCTGDKDVNADLIVKQIISLVRQSVPEPQEETQRATEPEPFKKEE